LLQQLVFILEGIDFLVHLLGELNLLLLERVHSKECKSFSIRTFLGLGSNDLQNIKLPPMLSLQLIYLFLFLNLFELLIFLHLFFGD
jgi:hypothetical protein